MPTERILATALKIVDDEGADALSLRTLAQRLDSSTSTLYRHFASRADLVNQLVDSLFGDVSSGTRQQLQAAKWDEACRLMASWMFAQLRAHPNMAPLLVGQPPVGPNTLARREEAFALFLSAGFAPETAARSFATIARYVLGFAMQLGVEAEDPQLAAALRDPDRTAFPATAAVSAFLPVPLQDEFEFGLELIIAGLAKYRD
jgi:AcrR family transcriptional regulator